MQKYPKNRNLSSQNSQILLFSQRIGLVVAGLGLLVILGWVFDITFLKGILPNLPTMKVNTALCFLLGGTALWLWHGQEKRGKRKGERKIPSLGLAFLIALIALLTLIQYGFDLNLGIDELLMQQPEPMASTAAQGRMAPNTALAFLFEGLAVLLMSVNRPNYLVAQALAIGGWLIGFVGLLGYVYGSVYFYTAGSYTGMAIHTAIAFLLLASGILCACPQRGLMALVCSDCAGSLIARRLLPFAIFVPSLVEGLCAIGYRQHLYNKEVEIALSSTLEIILFSGLVGWNAYKLNGLDSHRKRTELARQQVNEQLQHELHSRQQVEEALHVSQARLAGILEVANDAIISIDEHQHITLFNHGAEQMFGYRASEVLGQPLNLLIPTRFAANHHQQVSHFSHSAGIARRMGERSEIFARRKDGTEFPAEASISKLEMGCEKVFTAFMRDITERKQAQEALVKLAAIVESSDDAIISKSLDGIILSWNAGAQRIFGYSADEAIGQPMSMLMPPDCTDEESQILQKIQQGERIEHYETVRRRKDGQLIHVSVTISPIKDAAGKIVGASAINRDITERKRAEAALKESEERWQLAIRGTNDGIWDWNVKTHEVFFSARWKEMLGYEDDEIANHIDEWAQRVHPEDRDRVFQAIQEHFTKKSPFYMSEHRVQCKDGAYKWILDRGQALWDEAGNVLRMTGSHTDISDRFLAEEKLRHREAQLSTIISTIADGIIILDRTGKVCFANPAAVQLFDKSLEELIGYHWGMPVGETTELELMRGNKGIRTAEMRATAIEWLSQPAYIVALRDITERKQSELELQRAKEAAEVANQAKSIFLANMSHELRTPLNVILGFTQLMNRESSLPPEQFQNLQMISKSGNHLLNLINDVLDLSKIEAGRLTLDESCFDLIALVRSLHEMLRQKALAKGLQFNLEIAPNIPQYVSADSNKLRQILINLLGNAIKFTQTGSVTLRVAMGTSGLPSGMSSPEQRSLQKPENSASPTPHTLPSTPYFQVQGNGEWGREGQGSNFCSLSSVPNSHFSIPHAYFPIRFEVSDTGVGIAPTELETIFDAFVQTQAGKASHEGTGLGLTITRKFVQLMGGDITVTSTFHEGSTFSFDIQVCLAHAWDVQPTQPHRKVIGLASNALSYRILVADDQTENRLLLVKLLTQLGLEVREAQNGQEAFHLWQQWQPHLIWMDLRMPVMDGYVATEQIRSSIEGQSTIIIALTAQASNSDRTLALQVGCNDYITKPFQEETLFAKMAEHLELRYLYADNEPLDPVIRHDEEQAQAASLTPESLSVMSKEWMHQLYEAAELCDEETILHLLAQIPSEYRSLIAAMNYFARNYQFHAIAQLIQTLSSPQSQSVHCHLL